MEISARKFFKRQTICVLNHCYFYFSYFPPNDRIGQPFNKHDKEEFIAHIIVGINLSWKFTQCPVGSAHILAGYSAKRFGLGVQNFGVWFVLLPEETFQFIVAAFLSNGEGQVKNKSITGETGRKEMRTEGGSQSDPIGKRGNSLKVCKKVFHICETCEGVVKSGNSLWQEQRQVQSMSMTQYSFRGGRLCES